MRSSWRKPGVGDQQIELAHVPGGRWTSLRAKSTMDAEILILHHQAGGLRKRSRSEERLGRIDSRRRQSGPNIFLLSVRRYGQAIHRTNVHAGIAFDAQLIREVRLHVAVEATFRFAERLLEIEAQ